MAKEIKLSAVRRSTSGSSSAQALRRKGLLPAVICGPTGSRSIQIQRHDFELMQKHHTGENLIVDLDVEGEGTTKVLLREIQQGPIFGELLHADFVEIVMTRKMRVTIPVKLLGEPLGVSQEGGVLEHVLREIEVECLPGDLVDFVSVDVGHLNIGDTLLVRDLTVDPKLTVLSGPGLAVATVVPPHVEAEPTPEEAAAAAAPAEGTEPEVIGKKKEEGEAEEGEAEAKGAETKDKSKEKPAEKPKEKEKEKKGKGKDKEK
jgi:large subunit ribosomal protein L25